MNKLPKLRNLKIDAKGTQRIRQVMANSKKIKITINLDADLVEHVRQLATKRDVPYQRYLNRLLRDVIDQKASEDARIDHLEKELLAIKKKLAA